MDNKKVLVLMGATLISSVTLAGQSERHNPALRNATKESAIQFVGNYYSHLNRGMSRQQFDSYWTAKKAVEMDELTVRVSEITGKELRQESQRLMDLAHMEAKCEEIELSSAKTFGAADRKAKLRYNVRSTCADWKSSTQRTVTLQYSTVNRSWVIDRIENEEQK